MLKPKYYISKENKFVIENYNTAPTFSSFLPGIAGAFGCPMWVFYANRGQCITSAGVQDKDGAILEFNSANKAYHLVSLQGFRTFLKIDGQFYEPFNERSLKKNKMEIAAESLKIIEENNSLKVRVEVTYFTVPNESFPALTRMVKVTNLSPKTKKIEIIDGLPIIVPYGFDNDLLKKISQTTAAWCRVENLEKGAPFYKLKTVPADISETKLIEKGNFFAAFSSQRGKDLPVNIIVQPSVVFGKTTGLEFPSNFTGNFKLPARQQKESFIPCAFAYQKTLLKKGENLEIFSVVGQADSVNTLSQIKKRIVSRKYLLKKATENRALVEGLCSLIKTESASKNLDLYSAQTFLDNVLRGGLPVTFGNKIFYLYYRKHGDMERDYNDFKLMPTYFSQGNGNYRDINQNRRNDLYFNPAVGEDNLFRFINLIQLDGFNPLVVLGEQYCIKSPEAADALIKKHVKHPSPNLKKKLLQPFHLGSLVKDLEKELKTLREDFVADILNCAEALDGANHGEGFWTDHFTYNTDLLESCASIYPDKMTDLLLNQKIFTFFDNSHIVLPRKDKYFIVNGKVRQFNGTRGDSEKASLINRRTHRPNTVRTSYGRGEVYQTTLVAKLLCLIANKAASFDAEGVGLEMEADKPDWNDALNGLPGLLGSSLSETLELKRLCLFALKYISISAEISLPVEVKEFVDQINQQLTLELRTADAFDCWEAATQAKEEYREKTRLGLDGKEAQISGIYAKDFLQNVIDKCSRGVKKTLKKYRNYFTYFINEAIEFERINGKEIKIKKFRQRPLPLFLEGFVHALKVENDQSIYRRVKKSPLFDKKLKMYKINASLLKESAEIGRCRIFTPGWLENESIWLHMEYKYLLELLKAGLYKEFFSDFKRVLIPFTDPKKYGRSILENSSFIVSSAHPDKEKHGRGYYARLSGASAEFIDLWITMLTGKNIFYLDENGKLCFKLSPVLPAWLFKNGKLSFNLFGSIEVAYLNPKRKATFDEGVKPVAYKLVFDDREEIEIHEPHIQDPYASFIRNRKVKKIVCSLSV